MMRKIALIFGLACLFSGWGSAHAASLPTTMNCKISGYAGCNGDLCVGAGKEDSSLKLKISQASHTLLLNGIAGRIDDGAGDPYADGNHSVRWKWGVIAFATYRLSQPQPGRVFLTLHDDDSELEFHCLGSLKVKG